MFKDIWLETERLIIRPFNPNDAHRLHRIVSQKEVMKYLPEDVMSLEEVKKLIAWLIDCYEKNRPDHIIKFTTAVVWKQSELVIGWCGLGPLEFNPAETEIYFGLSKEYWARGLATEAAKAMLHHGFTTIRLDKIVAVVHPQNVASQKVLEKAGLRYLVKYETLPARHSYYDGYLYYSLPKDDYLSWSRA